VTLGADATHQSGNRIADIRVVIQLIADDMSVVEFGNKQKAASTSAESNVDEDTKVLPRDNRASYGVADGKLCGNARPQFRVLVALGNCTVGIVDSLGPLTEGFYDTAQNEAVEIELREIVPMPTPVAKQTKVCRRPLRKTHVM